MHDYIRTMVIDLQHQLQKRAFTTTQIFVKGRHRAHIQSAVYLNLYYYPMSCGLVVCCLYCDPRSYEYISTSHLGQVNGV